VQDRRPMTHDGEDLHEALCFGLLREAPSRGSKTRVCSALRIRPQYYSRVLNDPVCRIDTVASWISEAGMALCIKDYEVEYVKPSARKS